MVGLVNGESQYSRGDHEGRAKGRAKIWTAFRWE